MLIDEVLHHLPVFLEGGVAALKAAAETRRGRGSLTDGVVDGRARGLVWSEGQSARGRPGVVIHPSGQQSGLVALWVEAFSGSDKFKHSIL